MKNFQANENHTAEFTRALEALKKGQMVILVDDEDRENEGDLVMAAEFVTPEAINFMAMQARGLICLALTEEKIQQLELPMMVEHNTSPHHTQFTVSIEAREGVTTGISAYDRAKTIATAVADDCRPKDLTRPGHIFPLKAHRGGVLVRAGHTEGIIDLTKLTGLKSAGVLCEIMNPDGTMARLDDLHKFAQQHQLPIISLAEIIRYRLERERLVHRVAEAKLPTEFAPQGKLIVYKNDIDSANHLVYLIGEVKVDQPVLVRVHSECLTGDVFGSRRCDCGPQLEKSLQIIAKEGAGILLYLRQEGRGIGLVNKILAYNLQDQGADTVEANHRLGFKDDSRDYGIGVQILADLGIKKIRLLTNNPSKIVGLVRSQGFGMEVVERVAIETPANEDNQDYLRTKRDKLGHLLNLDKLITLSD
jgi:3,4-dihydroxy 2-butanone 4-phosphate synthase/GTP cyclohydrolase II